MIPLATDVGAKQCVYIYPISGQPDLDFKHREMAKGYTCLLQPRKGYKNKTMNSNYQPD